MHEHSSSLLPGAGNFSFKCPARRHSDFLRLRTQKEVYARVRLRVYIASPASRQKDKDHAAATLICKLYSNDTLSHTVCEQEHAAKRSFGWTLCVTKTGSLQTIYSTSQSIRAWAIFKFSLP